MADEVPTCVVGMCELPGTEIREVVTGEGHEPAPERFCTIHAAEVDRAIEDGSGGGAFARTGRLPKATTDFRPYWIGVVGGVVISFVCIGRAIGEGPGWLLPAAMSIVWALMSYRIATRPRPD